MDRRYPDAREIVVRMKLGARAFPWVPFGVVPRERYHFFPDGLCLCLTVDILAKDLLEELARRVGEKPPEESGEGDKFWHLSIARLGERTPTPEELEFWRRAFFEDEPVLEMRGVLTGTNTRHFFWRFE